MEREIPDNTTRLLRQACALKDAPLPDKIIAKFWELKTCADRIGYGLQLGDLVRLCVECGYGQKTASEAAGPTIAELWKAKKVKSGAAVVVHWCGKKVTARLTRVTTGGEAVVRLDNDPEERTVAVSAVSLAKAA